MDVDHSPLPMDEDAIPQSVYHQTSNFRAQSKTRQPTVVRRRAGSASDTERAGSDPLLRRKLGDITKKFESLELKYNNLKEVGIEEAKVNFEKLKASSEAKSKGKYLRTACQDLKLTYCGSCKRPDSLPEERSGSPESLVPGFATA